MMYPQKVDYAKFPAGWRRIIIDGDNGAGKSTLAREIASDLQANVVSVDEHLRRDTASRMSSYVRPGRHGESYLMQTSLDNLETEIIFACGLLLGIIAVLSDLLLRGLFYLITPWKRAT
jgi:ABC-type phosphate/phosphonate transport system ATPase subunit